MALSILNSQMFADRFKQDYQGSGKLRGTVQELHGLVGDSYKDKVTEAIAMSQRGAFLSDIPSQQPNYTVPSMTFENYVMKLSVDELEQLDINANLLTSFAGAHAKAMGRREDQFIIDALNNASLAKSVALGTTNLSIDKLLEARELLSQDEVEGELHIAITSNQLEALLKENQTQSIDYNSIRALVAGEVDTFLGFKFHTLGITSRTTEGGLPITGNDTTCFAWAKESVTLGYRRDPAVKMVDVPENLRIETISSMSAGAMVNRPKGAVQIHCKNDV